jgi:hypothetical protein
MAVLHPNAVVAEPGVFGRGKPQYQNQGECRDNDRQDDESDFYRKILFHNRII